MAVALGGEPCTGLTDGYGLHHYPSRRPAFGSNSGIAFHIWSCAAQWCSQKILAARGNGINFRPSIRFQSAPYSGTEMKLKKNPAAVALGCLGGVMGGKMEFYLTTVQNRVHF